MNPRLTLPARRLPTTRRRRPIQLRMAVDVGAWRVSRPAISEADFGWQPAATNGFPHLSVVAFVLVGVGDREVCDGPVEHI
jgi:hypothetical protein